MDIEQFVRDRLPADYTVKSRTSPNTDHTFIDLAKKGDGLKKITVVFSGFEIAQHKFPDGMIVAKVNDALAALAA